MPQLQPAANIYYRIQNVDYGYYLELPAAEDSTASEGRVLKDSVKQHWKFVATGAKNTYRIVNAANSKDSEDTYFSLGIDATDKSTTTEDAESGSTVWTVNIPTDSPVCTITAPNPSANKKPKVVLLQMDGDGSTKVDEDKHKDNQRWKIIEVLPFVDSPPPLPRGTYRIRNIDGTSVLTVHTDSLTLDPQEGGKHQAWEIIPKGNGLYEIKKVEKNEYLNWQETDSGVYKVVISTTTATWIIRSLGGFVYSISPKLAKKDLGLTAVNPDTNEILLTDRETARNQVWFIEPSKFNTGPDVHEAPIRYAIPGSTYYNIQNIANNYYAALVSGGSITAYSSAQNSWYLYYADSVTPYFTLLAYNTSNYAARSGDLVSASTSQIQWYLAKDGANSGYYIVPKDAPNLVWSGETRSGLFPLVERKANVPILKWKIGSYA